MILWTKDYNKFLSWVIYHFFEFDYFFEALDFEELDSLYFGYWYCEVRE